MKFEVHGDDGTVEIVQGIPAVILSRAMRRMKQTDRHLTRQGLTPNRHDYVNGVISELQGLLP